MENQITQQNTTELSYSIPTLLQQKTLLQHGKEPIASSYFLRQLIIRRPWLVWIGVGIFLFTIIYVSLLSITQTSYFSEEPQPRSVVATEPTPPSSGAGTLSWWLLGFVVFGGAAGAIAIGASPPITRRQQQMPALPVASSTIDLVPTSMQLPDEKILIVFTQKPLDLNPVAGEQLLQEDSTLLNLEQDAVIQNQAVAKTELLVEMLDLRKQLPLSTILGEGHKIGNITN